MDGLWKKMQSMNFLILAKFHKNLKLLDYSLFLDKVNYFIDASPNRIVSCSCSPRACLEVKCPCYVNFMSTEDPSVSLPYLQNIDLMGNWC